MCEWCIGQAGWWIVDKTRHFLHKSMIPSRKQPQNWFKLTFTYTWELSDLIGVDGCCSYKWQYDYRRFEWFTHCGFSFLRGWHYKKKSRWENGYTPMANRVLNPKLLLQNELHHLCLCITSQRYFKVCLPQLCRLHGDNQPIFLLEKLLEEESMTWNLRNHLCFVKSLYLHYTAWVVGLFVGPPSSAWN